IKPAATKPSSKRSTPSPGSRASTGGASAPTPPAAPKTARTPLGERAPWMLCGGGIFSGGEPRGRPTSQLAIRLFVGWSRRFQKPEGVDRDCTVLLGFCDTTLGVRSSYG